MAAVSSTVTDWLCLVWLSFQADEAEKKVACRFDWHQTSSTVTISVYAKLADPSKTVIEANKVSARLNIVFDAGNSYFNKSFILHGVRNTHPTLI